MLYLDYNATTPIDPSVRMAMLDCMEHNFANPASKTHMMGIRNALLLEESREVIADLIDAPSNHIYFTSGASESNNMVLKGVADHFLGSEPVHFIVSEVEHKCILNQCEYLKNKGVEISYAPVNSKGRVELDSITALVRPETKLISVMAANNETGVLMPINEIAQYCQDNKILFHTDAAQLVGKMPFSVQTTLVDFASFSSHKFYGPKGIGGLYCRNKAILLNNPLIHGGGQEYGLRGGTSNLPAIIGMAKAAKIAKERVDSDSKKQKALKIKLIENLKHSVPNITVNGCTSASLPNTLNFSLCGIKSSFLMSKLKNKVALSSGSACNSEQQLGSHVLSAMGLDEDQIQSSIRLSFGRETTAEELDSALQHLTEIYQLSRS
ncbi:Cysteine desulfurase [Photobacterium marinum]|uniref:cysteine desulfurase n=1 Tax=Photobacterium marinum TaxID=1056511 RepID=L8JCP3_9GAMM|nr:cysteine desulfurase family protein [Photobacterium marinum]ELR66606.1 Cysteine desulfurase [Photobacterium marinum]